MDGMFVRVTLTWLDDRQLRTESADAAGETLLCCSHCAACAQQVQDQLPSISMSAQTLACQCYWATSHSSKAQKWDFFFFLQLPVCYIIRSSPEVRIFNQKLQKSNVALLHINIELKLCISLFISTSSCFCVIKLVRPRALVHASKLSRSVLLSALN